MIFAIDRKYKDQVIKIPVKTFRPERIVIDVYHATKPNTSYFRTSPVIEGTDKFVIKIPKSPKKVIVELYNEEKGHLNNDKSFKIGQIQVVPLKPIFDVKRIMTDNVRSFAKFSDEFAENAGILSAQNSIYVSPDGKFRIDYKEVLRDSNGNSITSPARINTRTRIIELSRKYYKNYTVPGRKAVNWHEFAHMYLNFNSASEFEADRNAITIYLGLGNPKVEALNVFLKLFKNRPTDGNVDRHDKMYIFIKNFEKIVQKQLRNN